MVEVGAVAGAFVSGERVGVNSDGKQEPVKVLEFEAWPQTWQQAEELSLGLEQEEVAEEEEEEVVAAVVSLVKKGLLDKVCHKPLCTAGQTFQVPHMGKSDYAHVLGGS